MVRSALHPIGQIHGATLTVLCRTQPRIRGQTREQPRVDLANSEQQRQCVSRRAYVIAKGAGISGLIPRQPHWIVGDEQLAQAHALVQFGVSQVMQHLPDTPCAFGGATVQAITVTCIGVGEHRHQLIEVIGVRRQGGDSTIVCEYLRGSEIIAHDHDVSGQVPYLHHMAEPVYAPIILGAKTTFKLLNLKLDVRGSDHIPRTGGAVLACNHIGYLDFVFAGLGAHPAKRYVRFMAKDAIFKHRVGGPLMRGMKHISVDREAGAGSFSAATTAIEAGEIVGIFPEATGSRSFELKEFKYGAARLAATSGVPLIPCIVWGTQRILVKGRKADFKRGKAISVMVGEPLHPNNDDNMADVTADLKAIMSVMLEETIAAYPQRPVDDADRWWMPKRLGGTAPTLEEAAVFEKEERMARIAARKAAKAAEAATPTK